MSPYEADSQLGFLATNEVPIPSDLLATTQYLELATEIASHRLKNPATPPLPVASLFKFLAADEDVTEHVMSFLGDPPTAPLVDLVLSDDSDCVVLGIPKVFLKRDMNNNGKLYDKSSLWKLPEEVK